MLYRIFRQTCAPQQLTTFTRRKMFIQNLYNIYFFYMNQGNMKEQERQLSLVLLYRSHRPCCHNSWFYPYKFESTRQLLKDII